MKIIQHCEKKHPTKISICIILWTQSTCIKEASGQVLKCVSIRFVQSSEMPLLRYTPVYKRIKGGVRLLYDCLFKKPVKRYII